MLCAELERLESEFDDILTALEDPQLPEAQRVELEKAYAELSRRIHSHQSAGHDGSPCYEE
jgi:hypothetical protein